MQIMGNFPETGQLSAEMQELAELYKHMLNEINVCLNERYDELQRLQVLFNIAENHKYILRKRMRDYKFEGIDEEITYYREIKPLFYSETLFYTYCYHTESFLADCNCPTERINFLKRQMHRRDRFIKEHPAFCRYITGTSDNEQVMEWFTSPDGRENSWMTPTASKGELLMATWMALNRYVLYAEKKMEMEIQRNV
jgi:hypothetical protein